MRSIISILLCVSLTASAFAGSGSSMTPLLYVFKVANGFEFQLCGGHNPNCEAVAQMTTQEYTQFVQELDKEGAEEAFSSIRLLLSFVASFLTAIPAAAITHRYFHNNYLTASAIVVVTTLYANYGVRTYISGTGERPSVVKQLKMLLDPRVPKLTSVAIEIGNGEVWNDVEQRLEQVHGSIPAHIPVAPF